MVVAIYKFYGCIKEISIRGGKYHDFKHIYKPW